MEGKELSPVARERLIDLCRDAHLRYWEHAESCWYVGNPGFPGGRGCAEHNRLYDEWHHELRRLENS